MSADLDQRPTNTAPRQTPEVAPTHAGTGHWAILLAILLLLAATIAPMDRVYSERSWIAPVFTAAVLSVGVAAFARAFRIGPVVAVVASVLSWAWFASLAFLSHTMAAGFIPTIDTLTVGIEVWAHGMDLLQLRPAPAIPDTGLVLLTTAAVWAVGHAVHELVVRINGSLRAVLLALLLWIVPLGLSPAAGTAWVWAVPLLAAASMLLLVTSGSEAARWGSWSPVTSRPRRWPRSSVRPLGWTLTAAAIGLGVVAAPLLPGFGDPALYELRDLGGSTLTSNPIVSIRASLLSLDPRPVLRVSTPRPVYLRTTSLDRYSDREEWTNDGIRGTPFRSGSPVPFEVPIRNFERLNVDITIEALDQAVLVPMPYQPAAVSGQISDALQYDQRLSTFTLNRGVRLGSKDQYAVSAAIPTPQAYELEAVPAGWYRGPLLDLPTNVPAQIATLARQIVTQAEATTPFTQALALQNELRTWTYSLDPPSGHSGDAMRAFLESRIGYCEQFAGTMAVMLRTLGVPARVGVGFTPGEPVAATVADDAGGTGDYLIRASNAHAWVEVLFPGQGWIAFEPTPRTDGNVLVPSAVNLAPAQLASQEFTEIPDAADDDELPQDSASTAPATPRPRPTPVAPNDSGTSDDVLRILAALLLLSVGGAVLWVRRHGHIDVNTLAPAQQVVEALARVEAVTAALGRPRLAAETDREFLARITRAERAEILAGHVERARYATSIATGSVHESRAIAAELNERLLRPLDRRSRWWVHVKVAFKAGPASPRGSGRA